MADDGAKRDERADGDAPDTGPGAPGAKPPAQLALLFFAAAFALALVLSIVAVIAYYALSRGASPAGTNRTARLDAPVSGHS